MMNSLNLPKPTVFFVVAENGNNQMTSNPDAEYINYLHEEYMHLVKNSQATGSTVTQAHVDQCLRCPITSNFFLNPVITPSGHTYEENAIKQWIQDYKKDPLSINALELSQLRPNNEMKQIADTFCENDTRPKSELPRGVGPRTFQDVFTTFTEKLTRTFSTADRVATLPARLSTIGSHRSQEGCSAEGTTTSVAGTLLAGPAPVAATSFMTGSLVTDTLAASADTTSVSIGRSPQRYTQTAEQRREAARNMQAASAAEPSNC
jgi:hypothetical protein